MGRSTPRAHSRAEHGLEALRNPSLTPPLLEAVEEAEGHEAHLVAGEGPGVPGMGGEAHNTLGYRWATAQGTLSLSVAQSKSTSETTRQQPFQLLT